MDRLAGQFDPTPVAFDFQPHRLFVLGAQRRHLRRQFQHAAAERILAEQDRPVGVIVVRFDAAAVGGPIRKPELAEAEIMFGATVSGIFLRPLFVRGIAAESEIRHQGQVARQLFGRDRLARQLAQQLAVCDRMSRKRDCARGARGLDLQPQFDAFRGQIDRRFSLSLPKNNRPSLVTPASIPRP